VIPLVASTVARSLTSTIIYPFDYWKTIQQSAAGRNSLSVPKIGPPVAGYIAFLQRDVLFSGIYWILTENTRQFIKYLRNNSQEGTYDSKTTLIISNAIAGGFSGAVAAITTLPLDVIKTRRQLYPTEYEKTSNFRILSDIYKNQGFSAMFTGYRQRVAKVTINCAGVLTLYEFFNYLLQKNHMLE